MLQTYTYYCKYRDSTSIAWDSIEGVQLSDTAGSEKTRLMTIVKVCRTKAYIHVNFQCEDDHVVATYSQRDDPIYKEDVVEIFIDEDGTGTDYKEFEFSPRNVIFDARIHKEKGCNPFVDSSWNAAGLHSQVTADNNGNRIYEISIPILTFNSPPKQGTVWKINFYRIDEDLQGKRHYWAWSPTGAVNFHIPEKFGTLIFE